MITDETLKALHGKLIRAEYELGRAGVAASQDEADKPIAVSLELVRKCLALLPTLRAALAPPADGTAEVEAIKRRHEADSEFKTVTVGWLDEWKYRQVRVRELNAEELHADRATLLRLLSEERARRVEVEAEVADLKQTVIAFAGPHAARYGEEFGLGKDTLHPSHYDLLTRCGARMVDFKRGELPVTHKDTQDE